MFKSPLALFYAIIVHAILISVLVFTFDWSKDEDPHAKVEVVQAVAVDESKVEKQIENLKKIEERKRLEEQARQKKLQKQADDAKRARELEEQRLADTKKKRQLELKKSAEQEQKRKAEEIRLAKLKEKRIAEQKENEQLEIKRKREEEKLKKVREEQERVAEKQRQQEAAERKQREAEQQMLDQLLAEEEKQRIKQKEAAQQLALNKQQEAKNQSIITQYKGLIQNKISSNWRIPLSAKNAKPDEKCVLAVQLIPGGDVKHAEAVLGSCDPALKNSIEAAVYKAAPLPLPDDPALFENFRDLRLVFYPNESK